MATGSFQSSRRQPLVGDREVVSRTRPCQGGHQAALGALRHRARFETVRGHHLWQPQRAQDGAPVHYERHCLEQATLHRPVPLHAAGLFTEAESARRRGASSGLIPCLRRAQVDAARLAAARTGRDYHGRDRCVGASSSQRVMNAACGTRPSSACQHRFAPPLVPRDWSRYAATPAGPMQAPRLSRRPVRSPKRRCQCSRGPSPPRATGGPEDRGCG